MAPCIHATWRRMCAYTHAHVCVCWRVCMCVHVISGLSILFRIQGKAINMHTIYTREIMVIFVMWDYLCFCIFAGDMA